MAILFVPFAAAESSPKNINAGSVRDEPPPALTFITAAIAPMTNSMSDAIISFN